MPGEPTDREVLRREPLPIVVAVEIDQDA